MGSNHPATILRITTWLSALIAVLSIDLLDRASSASALPSRQTTTGPAVPEEPTTPPLALTGSVQQLQNATVCLHSAGDRCSAVIISASGLVLTAAHGIPSIGSDGRQASIRVRCHDGLQTTASVIFQDRTADVALLQLDDTDQRPWPFIPPARGASDNNDQWYLAAGYPGRESDQKSAVVRIGHRISHDRHSIRSSCPLTVGDSGGPLVNLHGELCGIHRRIGLAGDSNYHIAIESLQAVLKDHLNQNHDLISTDRPTGLERPGLERPDLDQNLLAANDAVQAALRQRTVTILPIRTRPHGVAAHHGAGEERLCGTLMNNGFVATKLSELGPETLFDCTFGDGRHSQYILRKADRSMDLAILQPKDRETRTGTSSPTGSSHPVDGRDDPADDVKLPPGLVVFATCADDHQSIGTGLITRGCHNESAADVRLGAVLDVNSEGQLNVQQIIAGSAAARGGMAVGDLLQTMDGTTPETLDSLGLLLKQREPGDWITCQVLRAGQATLLNIQLQAEASAALAKTEYLDGRAGTLSKRRNGFQNVLQHDLRLTPQQCGSPLVDSTGRLIGINIARRAREATLALPVEQILRLMNRDDSDH